MTGLRPGGPAPTVAIGVASQYSSTVPVRADGSPAGPVLMWRDRRGTDACHRLFRTPGMFELWVERHGIPPIGVRIGLRKQECQSGMVPLQTALPLFKNITGRR